MTVCSGHTKCGQSVSTCFPQKPTNLHESLFSWALSPYLLPVLQQCPLPSLIILLFILLGLAPKHARQRILEVQGSRVAVCKGEEITVTATLYILLCKEKATVFRMSLTYKRAGWQDTSVPQGNIGSKLWAKELQPKAGRGKVCNQLCLLALCYLLPMGRVYSVKHQALKRRLLLLEVDSK